MRHVRLAFCLLLSLLPAIAARAQSVRWEATEEPGAVALVFENCSPNGNPDLPGVPGVQFTLAGQSTSTNIINFTRTDSVTLTYRTRARAGTPLSIPAFDVKTDKGTLHVAAFNGTAGGLRASSLDNAVSSRLMPATVTVWAGEVFPLTYTLDVLRRNFSQLSPTIDWNPAPLITEEWSKPEAGEVVVNGEARFNIVYKSRALAKSPGPLTIDSANQLVNLQTGSIGFGIFQTPRVEQLTVESNHPQITVRALPPAPAGFSGGVGDFKLVSKVVPDRAAVGEPVTWTLELSGTGNWPDLAGLPAREVSNDFQVVQPKAKRTPAEGKLFDVTLAEDVVLVPTKAGAYVLGPVNFVYFDPKSGSYRTISAARTTLNITAPNAPKLFNPVPAPTNANEGAPPPPATSSELDQSKIENLKSKIPVPPAGLPRDPLPGAAAVRTPLEARTLATLAAAPFALLFLFWTWLAVRRAQRTDPARPRREARQRLVGTLAEIRSTPPSALSPRLLLAWQHDAAVLWQIAHAAPPATALTDQAWAALWLEADRSLYGAKPALPADWVPRAEAALAAKRVAGFNPLRLFLPRNLLPFAALVALMVIPLAGRALGAAEGLRASTDPIAAYRRGDFATAEKSWRAAVVAAPTDWIARHNLSLALAQRDHAAEAAAQATAAFVQHPADRAARWHFLMTCEKAGFAPAALTSFLAPGPRASLAQLASPADWQLALVAAAALAALALGGMLANAYGRRARIAAWSAGALLGLSVILAAAALLGVREFGPAADARAVVAWRAGTLRSIPTEADTTQKTTPLAAGSVAIADKSFLGWTRLSFENGQTGWVRTDELVPLWR